MQVRRGALAAVCAGLLFSVTACGGADDNNSGERPTIDQLQADIVDATKVDPTYALCIAEGLNASTLPNGVIRKVAKGENAEVDGDNRKAYAETLQAIKDSCDAMITDLDPRTDTTEVNIDPPPATDPGTGDTVVEEPPG